MDVLDSVVDAASRLDRRPRRQRWAHVSLCVLDAVFSIGARYATTVRTCRQYATHAGLDPLETLGPDAGPAIVGTADEQSLSVFRDEARRLGIDDVARTLLGNRQRTSPRGGVLKAQAALEYAEILVDERVERYADVAALFADEDRLAAIERRLRAVRGNGTGDVRLGYLWMLLGDDTVIKPDRMVLRWLSRAADRDVPVAEARGLVAGAAERLGCTSWELDHAIWNAERALPRQRIGSDNATRRRYRAHQGRWREDVLGLPPGPPSNARVGLPAVDNMLPREHDGIRAEDAGWKLMSDAAVEYTRDRLDEVRAADGLAEPDRLWRNMLSSQPLAFSIVGELRAYEDAALSVLSTIAGTEFAGFTTIGPDDAWRLDGLQAEWAPRREEHTKDRSGFDIAAALQTSTGRRFLLTVEVKYTDDFSRAKFDVAKVDPLALVGLDGESAAPLVTKHSQFLRSVLLTESVRQKTDVDDVLAVVLCRDDDSTAKAAVDALDSAQSTVPVARWSLEQFLDVAGGQPDLAGWAEAMTARYLTEESGRP